jgi:ferredoxin
MRAAIARATARFSRRCERRLVFTEHDVHYLANLCHNCGACLYACQYAPPHEFDLNFPRVLAQVRGRPIARTRGRDSSARRSSATAWSSRSP